MRRQQILDHVMPMSARVFVGAGSDEFGHGADPHKCVARKGMSARMSAVAANTRHEHPAIGWGRDHQIV